MIIRFGTLPSQKAIDEEAKRILESGIDPPVITDPDLLDAIIYLADDSVTFVGPTGREITRHIAKSIREHRGLRLIVREP